MHKLSLLLMVSMAITACADEDITAPVVETRDPSGITTTEAIFNGELVVVGTKPVTALGFQYATGSVKVVQGIPQITSALDIQTDEVGPFNSVVSGLQAGTKYYYHAVAETSELLARGVVKSFITPS